MSGGIGATYSAGIFRFFVPGLILFAALHHTTDLVLALPGIRTFKRL